MDEILKWSEGNPGALTFLMEVYMNPDTNFIDSYAIDKKIRKCPTLRGTNLYVLYSDICGRDIKKVVTLCNNCPNEILEDACNRQDYSGRSLIAEYLK